MAFRTLTLIPDALAALHVIHVCVPDTAEEVCELVERCMEDLKEFGRGTGCELQAIMASREIKNLLRVHDPDRLAEEAGIVALRLYSHNHFSGSPVGIAREMSDRFAGIETMGPIFAARPDAALIRVRDAMKAALGDLYALSLLIWSGVLHARPILSVGQPLLVAVIVSRISEKTWEAWQAYVGAVVALPGFGSFLLGANVRDRLVRLGPAPKGYLNVLIRYETSNPTRLVSGSTRSDGERLVVMPAFSGAKMVSATPASGDTPCVVELRETSKDLLAAEETRGEQQRAIFMGKRKARGGGTGQAMRGGVARLGTPVVAVVAATRKRTASINVAATAEGRGGVAVVSASGIPPRMTKVSPRPHATAQHRGRSGSLIPAVSFTSQAPSARQPASAVARGVRHCEGVVGGPVDREQRVIVIPSGSKSLARVAFSFCENLEEVVFEEPCTLVEVCQWASCAWAAHGRRQWAHAIPCRRRWRTRSVEGWYGRYPAGAPRKAPHPLRAAAGQNAPAIGTVCLRGWLRSTLPHSHVPYRSAIRFWEMLALLFPFCKLPTRKAEISASDHQWVCPHVRSPAIGGRHCSPPFQPRYWPQIPRSPAVPGSGRTGGRSGCGVPPSRTPEETWLPQTRFSVAGSRHSELPPTGKRGNAR